MKPCVISLCLARGTRRMAWLCLALGWAGWLVAAPIKHVQTYLGEYPLEVPAPNWSKSEDLPPIPLDVQHLPPLPSWKEPVDPKAGGWGIFAGEEDYYQEGLLFLQNNQIAESLQRFEKVIQDYPTGKYWAASHFWRAQILMRQGKEEAATKGLWQVLGSKKYSKYSLQSAHTIIWLLLKQGQIDQALEQVDRFQEIIRDPLFQESLLPLKAYGLLQRQNAPQALVALNQLKDQYPTHPTFFETVVHIAEVHFLTQKWALIPPLIEEYRENFYNHPWMERLLILGIWSDLNQKNWTGAQRKLTALEERGTRYQEAISAGYFYLGLYQNQSEKAIKALARFNDPGLRSAYWQKLFRYASEKKWYKFLARTTPEPQVSEHWKGELALIKGYSAEQNDQPDEAYQAYQLAAQDPKDRWIQEQGAFNAAALELKNQQFRQASERLNRMFVDFPESPRRTEYLFWYGVALHELKSPNATIALKQIESPSERLDDSLLYLGRIYQERKNFAEAIRLFQELTSDYPESNFRGAAYFYWAQSLLEAGQTEKAKQTLEKAFQSEAPLPSLSEAGQLYAQILLKLGQAAEADQFLVKHLQKSSDFGLVQLRLDVLAQLGQREKLVEVAKASLNNAPNEEQKAAVALKLAQALAGLNRLDEASKFYQQALQNSTGANQRLIRHELTKLAYEAGRDQEFLSTAAGLLQEKIQDDLQESTLGMLGEYYANKKETTQAHQYFQQLVTQYESGLQTNDQPPERRADLLIKLAEVKTSMGKASEAEGILKQAANLNLPAIAWRIAKAQGTAAYQQKHYEPAVDAYLQVAYLDESLTVQERFTIFSRIAESYMKLLHFEEAQAIYRKMSQEFKEADFQQKIQKMLKGLEQQKPKVSRETGG